MKKSANPKPDGIFLGISAAKISENQSLTFLPDLEDIHIV